MASAVLLKKAKPLSLALPQQHLLLCVCALLRLSLRLAQAMPLPRNVCVKSAQRQALPRLLQAQPSACVRVKLRLLQAQLVQLQQNVYANKARLLALPQAIHALQLELEKSQLR
jgi:hypothetical protein